jgi:hypothetical protein
MQPEDVTVEMVETAWGHPLETMKGKCSAVARSVLDAGLVQGRMVRGHYIGDVNQASFWAKRGGLPFIQHTWLQLEDGRIFDPTRWTFKGDEPFLWIGPGDHGDYDPGGNQFRMATRFEWPDDDESARRVRFEISPQAIETLCDVGADLDHLLEGHDGLDYTLIKFEVSMAQAHWIANIAPGEYQSEQDVRDVFIQLREQGLAAFVPLDNMRMVLGTPS